MTGSAEFVLDRPLEDGDRLFAVQRICTETSDVEGPTVRVTRGRMHLEVAPVTAQGGTATSVLMNARDADTGGDLPGRDVAIGAPSSA